MHTTFYALACFRILELAWKTCFWLALALACFLVPIGEFIAFGYMLTNTSASGIINPLPRFIRKATVASTDTLTFTTRMIVEGNRTEAFITSILILNNSKYQSGHRVLIFIDHFHLKFV